MKRIAITGPTGAIGVAIINEMISHNIEVIAICNPDSKRICRIPYSPLVRIVLCDLNDLGQMDCSALPKCDVFYHLAWAGTFGEMRNNMSLQVHNIKSALESVELAYRLGCTTYIGSGSQAEYGRVEGVLKPDTPVNPENGYGMAKLCAGQMTRIHCTQIGLRHIWLRVLSIYGPYDGNNTMIMSTIYKLLAGKSPDTTKGEQLWDYLYSKDAGIAFYLAGLKGKDKAIYCLGSGEAYPLKEYIVEIQKAVNPEVPIGFGNVPYALKQVMYLCADITELQKDTGFFPETSFAKGIRETVRWCKEQG